MRTIMGQPTRAEQVETKREPEPLISLEQTALCFGLRRSWLYKQTQGRRIPFYKVGHYCMFRRSEVEAFLQQRRIEPQDV
jgi:excisionase family DNA binding protein